MSLHKIYRDIPFEDRICEGCGEAIQRNMAYLDDKKFHFGCLKRTKAKPTHQCLDCFSYLTGKGINKVTVDGITSKTCGNCGSFNLRYIKRRFGF